MLARIIRRRKIRRKARRLAQSGQGMTEYIIIVGLVALLLIAAVRAYRNEIAIAIVGTRDQVEKNATGPDDSAGIGGGATAGGVGGPGTGGTPGDNGPGGGENPGDNGAPGGGTPGNNGAPGGGTPANNTPGG